MEPRIYKSQKAQHTYEVLVKAACKLLSAGGPDAVTYRKVAREAEVSVASVQYHFETINCLLSAAAKANITRWVARANRAAEKTENMPVEEAIRNRIDLLIEACLPNPNQADYTAHYSQLVSAGFASEVTRAYSSERELLDQAVARILQVVGWDIDPRLIIATVDGASVAAISEGRSVRINAASILAELYFRTGDSRKKE